MKKLILLMALSTAVASASNLLPVYDPFADATAFGGTSYAPGDPLYHQVNASGNLWYAIQTNNTTVANRIVITNANLTHLGLPGAGGNAARLRNVANGRGARLFVGSEGASFIRATNHNATVYYSLLVQLQDITSLRSDGNGECFIGFNNNATVDDQAGAANLQGAGLFFRKVDSTTFEVGLGKNPAQDTINVVFDATPRSVGEILFIVASYEFIYDAGNPLPDDDNVRMWINPPAVSFGAQSPPAPTLSILGAGTDINAFISSFSMVHRSTAAPNVTVVDDVRVGRTWTFVTGGPEFHVALADTAVPYSSNLNLTVSARSGGPSALSAYR
jgi:hypothetical protein